jgi:hypothetical protein
MLPSRRMIIAALIIILINFAMMIVLAQLHWFGRVIAVVGMIFIGLVIVMRKDAARAPIWFVVVVTLAIQLPHLLFVPRTSDDAYRYIWDGRVLLAGIDPYHFVPLDPELAHLRDPLHFPEGEAPLINRPGVPTIYPPIAQLWFWAGGVLHSAGRRDARCADGGSRCRHRDDLVAGPVSRYAGWLGVAVRCVPSGGVGGCERRPPGRRLGAVRVRNGLGGVAEAALAGRHLPRPGRWHQAGAAAAGTGFPAAGPLSNHSDRTRLGDGGVSCRTCWQSVPGGRQSCPATGGKRGTTQVAGSRCLAGCPSIGACL